MPTSAYYARCAIALASLLMCAPNARGAAPLPVANVAQVSAGGLHTCVLATGGTVSCLGSGYFGQIGDGGTFDRPVPTAVNGLSLPIGQLATGVLHSCALNGLGGVQCWGHNFSGQLGDGSTTTPRVTAVDVVGLSSGVRAIAAGGFHTCALLDDDSLRCWGDNSAGQLGDSTTFDRSLAAPVLGLTEAVVAVAAGAFHTCAILASGGLRCWGDNTRGQLGDNSGFDQSLPVAVTGLGASVDAIALGGYHSCARLGSGVKCWGANFAGQLGDGSTTDRPQPVAVPNVDVALLSAGAFHTCALTGVSIECWGYNVFGQLGDGGQIDSPVPVTVLGADNATGLSAGGIHACVWVGGDVARCWGNYDLREFAAVSAVRDAASLQPATDASGRYVLFESDASDLLATSDTNSARDIFRLDRQSGERVRVSLDDAESEILGASSQPALSADGQLAVFVAPEGAAVRRLRGETHKQQAARHKGSGFAVYLRNLATGTTQRVGQATTLGAATAPQIAPGGAAVVFTTTVTDPNLGAVGQDNVVRVPLLSSGNERVPGVTRCVTCKTIAADGSESSGNAEDASRNATVSEDGAFVVFETAAKNLLVGATVPCPEASTEILLRNMITGVSQRMSSPLPANCGPPGSGARKPKVDWPGRKIAFESDQPLGPGDSNGVADVYAVDLTQRSLHRISETEAGAPGDAASLEPAISGDGSSVSFVTAANNLDPASGIGNGKSQLHVRRLAGGPVRRLSRTALGEDANGDTRRPALSYNGTALVFDSMADNLAPGAPEAQSNVYARSNPDRADVVFAAGFE